MALQSLIRNRAISSDYPILHNHYFPNQRLVCYKCGTRGQENDVIYDLTFVLSKKNKILIKIFKPKFICIKCAIEEWLQKFDSLEIGNLIRIKRKRFYLKHKKVSISFKKYFKIIKLHPEKIEEINQVLCDMEILSFQKDGNNPISIKGKHSLYYVSKRYIPSCRSVIEQYKMIK